jgi:hypothetical protein
VANGTTTRLRSGLLAIALWTPILCAESEAPTFRSDVSMGRLDVQVLDGAKRTIPSLFADDFILSYQGNRIPVRDFSYEQLPVDVLLLLDTSGSMRPHMERVASAAHRALAILGAGDRVGIMIFKTRTKVRLELESDHNKVESTLEEIVNRSFGGGTDINRALLDAAAYIGKEGRREARRAIVAVTDDLAKPCDHEKVLAALSEAGAVLITLLTPQVVDQPGGPGRTPGPVPPPVIGTPWPFPGGGGPLGGVIWGPRRRTGRAPPTGPPWGGSYPGETSAGSGAIADDSGGESLPSNAPYALETAFERLRQQYAMYFYLPEGIAPGEAGGVELDLTNAARRRHPDAELRYRQVHLSGAVRRTFVRRVPARPPEPEGPRLGSSTGASTASASSAPVKKRRPAVNERTGPRVTLSAPATASRRIE